MKSHSASRTVLAAVLGSSLAYPVLTLPAAAQAAQSATQVLLDKAHTLETKGRMDMAALTWQQVLLSDPNNPEALSGLARAAKLSGNGQLSASYLERLRAVNPNDPGSFAQRRSPATINATVNCSKPASMPRLGSMPRRWRSIGRSLEMLLQLETGR